jgi:uncharacterized protein (DUF983 family)
MPEVFCVKCQIKRDDPHAQRVVMKNKRIGLKGKCPVCGAKMFQLGG